MLARAWNSVRTYPGHRGGHGDSRTGEFDRQSLGIRGDPGLDRRVPPHGDEAGGAGDVDDGAVPAGPHRSPGRGPQDQHRANHHVDGPLVRTGVLDQQGGVDPEPGVVDQEVDRGLGARHPRRDPEHVVALGQVGRDHLDLHRVARGDLGGHLRQPLGIPGYQDEIVSAPGQRPSERRSDPCRAPGHQRSSHAATLWAVARAELPPARARAQPRMRWIAVSAAGNWCGLSSAICRRPVHVRSAANGQAGARAADAEKFRELGGGVLASVAPFHLQCRRRGRRPRLRVGRSGLVLQPVNRRSSAWSPPRARSELTSGGEVLGGRWPSARMRP